MSEEMRASVNLRFILPFSAESPFLEVAALPISAVDFEESLQKKATKATRAKQRQKKSSLSQKPWKSDIFSSDLFSKQSHTSSQIQNSGSSCMEAAHIIKEGIKTVKGQKGQKFKTSSQRQIGHQKRTSSCSLQWKL